MSTPSGKPFDPFDISAYAPKRARNRLVANRQDGEQFSTESNSADDDVAQAPPYGMEDEQSHLAAQSEHPVDLDQCASASEPEPVPEQPGPDAQELGEEADLGPAESAPDDLEVAGSLRNAKAGDDRLNFADAPGLARANPSSELPADRDDDIERLESSLRWLRRESAAGRLPRATQLPPVRGLARTRSSSRKGETYINGFRLPRSLEPEFVPPPPIRARRDHLRGPMRIVIASVIAAPIAYYFTTGGVLSDMFTNRTAKFASLDTRVPQYAPIGAAVVRPRDPAEGVSPRGETVGMLPPAANPETKATAPGAAAASERVSSKDAAGFGKTAALPRPETAPAPAQVDISSATQDPPRSLPGPAQASAPNQPIHRLDPEDIRLLVQQGEQFVAAGDLVTARVVFQRAAEAGDAMAALAMGATYDPIVLAKLGVRGIAAEVEKARSWYEKARDFGSSEAPRRLEMLANR